LSRYSIIYETYSCPEKYNQQPLVGVVVIYCRVGRNPTISRRFDVTGETRGKARRTSRNKRNVFKKYSTGGCAIYPPSVYVRGRWWWLTTNRVRTFSDRVYFAGTYRRRDVKRSAGAVPRNRIHFVDVMAARRYYRRPYARPEKHVFRRAFKFVVAAAGAANVSRGSRE